MVVLVIENALQQTKDKNGVATYSCTDQHVKSSCFYFGLTVCKLFVFVCLFVCLSTCLFLFVCLFVKILFVCLLSACMSVGYCVCWLVCLSYCLSVCLIICFFCFVLLCLFVCLFVCDIQSDCELVSRFDMSISIRKFGSIHFQVQQKKG